MKLIELVEQAHMAKRHTEIEFLNEERLKSETKIKELLNDWGITEVVAIFGNTVTTPDMKMRAVFRDGMVSGWQVHGTCPKCHESVWSWEVARDDLATLGEMVADFIPDYTHHCRPAEAQTWQEKLAEALAEALNN